MRFHKLVYEAGGIIGISLNPSAVQRWVMTAHDRARFADSCLQLCGLDDCSREADVLHKECHLPRMSRDEDGVQRVEATICWWFNPFGDETLDRDSADLVNLSSGLMCSEQTTKDLLEAEQQGKEAFQRFIKNCVVDQCDKFHDPIQKLKLSTFAVRKERTTTRSALKVAVLKADCALFSKMAVIAQQRHLDIREVLAYPLSAAPLSLCTAEGTMVKTNKAALLQLLSKTDCTSHEPAPPSSAALIVDAMALLRTPKPTSLPGTLGELAKHVFICLARNFPQFRRIDFVADTYPEYSNKDVERSQRAQSHGEIRLRISSGQQHTPKQWAKFLSSGSSKTELVSFLVTEWSTDAYASHLKARQLYATDGISCVKLVSPDGLTTTATECLRLNCSHEVADTRLLLHARDACAEGYTSVTIKSPDTDVAVLGCGLSHRFPDSMKLLFLPGSRSKVLLLNLSKIGSALGTSVCDALIGMHAFTGCDTVSAFHGKGKTSAYQLLTSDGSKGDLARSSMAELGKAFNPLSAGAMAEIERFVCMLYGRSNQSSVNSLRYELFCLLDNAKDSSRLPPCHDALRKHAARANFQAAVW